MVSQNVITLANDLMEDFRINGTKTHETYGTFYTRQSRLGILKTTVKFEDAVRIIKKSLELLKREYEIDFSNIGMYYSISKRKEDVK